MTKRGRPPTLPSDVVKTTLKRMGAKDKGRKGDHWKFEMEIQAATAKLPPRKASIPVPDHRGDIAKGTFRSIMRQLGPRQAEFWAIVLGDPVPSQSPTHPIEEPE